MSRNVCVANCNVTNCMYSFKTTMFRYQFPRESIYYNIHCMIRIPKNLISINRTFFNVLIMSKFMPILLTVNYLKGLLYSGLENLSLTHFLIIV